MGDEQENDLDKFGDLQIKPRYTSRELDAIANRYLVKRRGDLSDLSALPAKAKAYIVESPHWQIFIKALMFDAAMGHERVTRGQLRAIDWFKKQALSKKEIEADTTEIEVVPANELEPAEAA